MKPDEFLSRLLTNEFHWRRNAYQTQLSSNRIVTRFLFSISAQQITCEGTSDAGSQNRCGRVGRGIQPPASKKKKELFGTIPKFQSLNRRHGS